jgi:hypothetical protein
LFFNRYLSALFYRIIVVWMTPKIVVVFLPFLLVCGCVSGPVCDKPYIHVGSDCCLDKDDNRICDRDEATTTTVKPTTTTTTTAIPTTTIAPKEVPPAKGELVGLELSKSEVFLGEEVTVSGTFRNLGSTEVPVVLRCNVVSPDNGISVFSGGETGVPAGKEGRAIVRFTPSKPGRYVIRGRVYFVDKMSSEQTATLEVKAL